MKSLLLTGSLLLLGVNHALAQRYGIGSNEGMTGLKIFGLMVIAVAAITVVLYIRQRKK